MKAKYLVFILILLISSVSMYMFGQLSQDITEWEMIPYNNTTIPSHVGFIEEVKCPYGCTDNLTYLHTVEEHKKDNQVSDMRIKAKTIWYCPKHHVQFTIVPNR